MSRGKMERSCFEEKKQLALDGFPQAKNTASDVNGFLSLWS